jgi:hypothetical protein
MASVAENECSHREQSWQWQETNLPAQKTFLHAAYETISIRFSFDCKHRF